MQVPLQDAERISAQREAGRAEALQNIQQELQQERALNSQFRQRINECRGELDDVRDTHKQLTESMNSARYQEVLLLYIAVEELIVPYPAP